VADLSNLGGLFVTLGAKTEQLQRDLDKAQQKLQDTETSMRSVINSAAKLGIAAVAAGAAIVTGLVASGLEAIDNQYELARSMDATIDGLRALQLAAKDAGVEEEALAQAARALNARLGEAQRQGGEARDVLRALGLSAAELSRMDVDKRFAAIADRVRELGLSSAQTGDVLRTLGIRSLQMVEFMQSGGDAVRGARLEIEEFGLSISEVDAAKVEAAKEALERVGLVLESVRNELTIALAPILEELATRFNNLVKANGGFAESLQSVIAGGIRGFGKMADTARGLHVVLKGAELIGVGFGSAMLTVFDLVIQGFVGLDNAIAKGTNSMIEQLNKLPGVDILPVELTDPESGFAGALRRMADESRDRVGAIRAELHELAMTPMPSENIEEFFTAVQARAEEAAQATVAARNEIAAGAGAEDFAVEEDPTFERLKQRQAEQLAAMKEFAMTELELEMKAHMDRLAALENAIVAEQLTEAEANKISEAIEQAHQDELTRIIEEGALTRDTFEAANLKQRVALVSRELANITGGVAQHSRAMFELNKAAGIANAIIATHQGAAEALKLGPIIGPALAAAQIAAGFAQVNAIRSQSFGGKGGAAPSLAGGTPASPVTPVSGAVPGSPGGGAPRQSIFVEGLGEDQLFSGKTVRALLKRLQEAADDGATLVFE
jgi:hypothetical protein